MENSALLKIQAYKKDLELNKYVCTPIQKKQYNFETDILINKSKFKLLVYFGKKGVKTVLQGNSSSKEYQLINNLLTGNNSFNFEKVEHNYDEYIGTDESGKGDFFGPLVVSGFYYKSSLKDFLVNLGVKDSKELSDPQIDKIAKSIISELPSNFSTLILTPEKYNKLYTVYNNLNDLLSWAHSQIIEKLLSKFNAENVIIDKFSKKEIEIAKNSNFAKINFVQLEKAESYLGVAAASILARHELNKWFSKYQQSGYPVIKGASNEVENKAKQIVEKEGAHILTKISKTHFKTTKKIFEN